MESCVTEGCIALKGRWLEVSNVSELCLIEQRVANEPRILEVNLASEDRKAEPSVAVKVAWLKLAARHNCARRRIVMSSMKVASLKKAMPVKVAA